VTLVLLILGYRPDLRRLGSPSLTQKTATRARIRTYHHHHHLNLILSNIPYQGGGDYRGIYDIGFKRSFMGYRGLLLNDPYKRDRIDGWLLDIFRLRYSLSSDLSVVLAI
jgi:hypothetical protein